MCAFPPSRRQRNKSPTVCVCTKCRELFHRGYDPIIIRRHLCLLAFPQHHHDSLANMKSNFLLCRPCVMSEGGTNLCGIFIEPRRSCSPKSPGISLSLSLFLSPIPTPFPFLFQFAPGFTLDSPHRSLEEGVPFSGAAAQTLPQLSTFHCIVRSQQPGVKFSVETTTSLLSFIVREMSRRTLKRYRKAIWTSLCKRTPQME